MGYNVYISESDITIKKESFSAACKALLPMFRDSELRKNARGGYWSGGTQNEWFYSWVSTSRAVNELKGDNLPEFLEEIGFWPDLKDGDICNVGYDSKTGQEDLFWEKLAPFVEKGSTIDWVGEDGDHWRWSFNGKTMTQKSGKVVYD